MPILNIRKPMQVVAKTLKIHMKVCDQFSAQLVDQNGEEIYDQESDYVPGFMPGEHYGDYLILDIDLETGKILNWKPPTTEAIEKWLNSKD